MQEGIFTMPFSIPFMGDQFNILPIYLVSLVIQMGMMPTPDNAQVKIMKFMPYIFFPSFTFASGLVLYWTVNNLFTIGQQWMINRNNDFSAASTRFEQLSRVKKKCRKKQARQFFNLNSYFSPCPDTPNGRLSNARRALLTPSGENLQPPFKGYFTAAKAGGGDPDMNPKLRTVLLKAPENACR